jgi:RNA polymerase sigma factor (TIGR02999 family)
MPANGSEREDVTQLLVRLNGGDASAADRLMPLVYEELKAIASRAMRAERPGHTLQATALVHEAYLRMIDGERADWKGRSHFMAIAARTIRNILVDHARRTHAEKRGGHRQRTSLHEDLHATEGRDEAELLALDEALDRLAGLHPRQSQVVEMRFFAGLSLEETAHALGVARSTVADDWTVARAWLSRELSA